MPRQSKKTPEEKREHARRKKWAQRQRKIGKVVTIDDAPPPRDDVNKHPKPYAGKLDDPLAEWHVAFEAAMVEVGR